MRLIAKLAALAVLSISLVAAHVAQAVEPNEDFATATGPLTAGQAFNASLETATDVDFQFFYLPDVTEVSVTTTNTTEKRGGAADRGRTIVSSLLRGRKGKLPAGVPGTVRTVKPGKSAKVKVTLLPGKYFVPVGHATSSAAPLANVPFRLTIGPVGSTTDSYEIFERRCRDAKRATDRIESSIRRTAKRIQQAKRNDAPPGQIVKLKLKQRDKREKADMARRAEKFACSIPR